MIEILLEDSAFRAVLQRLQEAGDDMAPAMDDIGGEMEAAVLGRFQTRTDPLGNPWAPWKPSTRKRYPFPGTAAAKRAGKAGNGRLLDRFGDMLESLSYQADANSVRWGFGQFYATFDEYGTKHMERRGLLTADPEAGTLGPEDEEAVIGVLQSRFDKIARG